ncbi:MAG: hypothetical protein ACFFCI_00260 [Promethearchaeota archaeon]
MKVKCIETALYDGGVKEISGLDDILYIILALSPSIPPTPCFYFQSSEIFDTKPAQLIKAEEVELVIKLSDELTKSIRGTFDYTYNIIIYVKNGKIYDQLISFIPTVEQELDWIYDNLKRDCYYDIKKVSQNKFLISLKT